MLSDDMTVELLTPPPILDCFSVRIPKLYDVEVICYNL